MIKQLGKDLIPAGGFNRRFSLTTDGKSMTYSIDKERDDLWLLTGYRQPGFWNQIKETPHLN